MKVSGRVGNRIIEFDGKKKMLHEKSYKAGHKAAMKVKGPECVFRFRGCQMSFAAGYSDGMKEIQNMVEDQKSVISFCKAI